jgi:hypothetical protein
VVSFTPPVPESIGYEAGCQSERCGEGRNLLLIPGIESRLLDYPARGSSLHRLTYPGFLLPGIKVIISMLGRLVGLIALTYLLTELSPS